MDTWLSKVFMTERLVNTETDSVKARHSLLDPRRPMGSRNPFRSASQSQSSVGIARTLMRVGLRVERLYIRPPKPLPAKELF